MLINLKLRHYIGGNTSGPYGDAYCTVDGFKYDQNGKTAPSGSSGTVNYYTHYFPLQLSDGYNYSISINCVYDSSGSGYYNGYITVTSEAIPITNSLGTTLVGGSNFEIKAGKTCVNNTAYDITSGRTVVNGVDYGVGTEYTYPTAEELFADMVVYNTGFCNSSSTGVVSISYDNLPTTGTCYLISSAGSYFGIWKLLYRWPWPPRLIGIASSALRMRAASSGGPIQTVDYESYDGSSYIINNTNASSKYYGGTLAAVQFPHYSDLIVDTVLSSRECVILASRNSDSAGTSTTTVKTGEVIISTSRGYIDARKGSDWTLLSGTATSASSVSGSVLSATSAYGNKIVLIGTKENMEKTYNVAISGTGGTSYGTYVTINGVDYSSATSSLTVNYGDIIEVHVQAVYPAEGAVYSSTGTVKYNYDNGSSYSIWSCPEPSSGTYPATSSGTYYYEVPFLQSCSDIVISITAVTYYSSKGGSIQIYPN